MKWQGQQVLVTGGTGFVGAHLVERLVKAGAQVVTTAQTLAPQSYFFHRKLDRVVTVSQTDVNDFAAVQHLITKFNIQYIFHLAAQPLVDVAYYNPRQTLETNIMGTVNILESARLYPLIKAVIVASSDKAYGKHGEEKYLETHPLRGDHPYEVSKSAADLITLSYAKTYQLPVVVSRFGNIYGEGDLNFSRLIPGLMQSLVQKDTLQLRSDGSFVRDYLHVKDVVNGYLLMAEQIATAQHQAFNFGSSDTRSVLEVLQIAQKSLRKKVHFEVQDTAKNEIPYQSLDFSKAKRELGWKPKLTLEMTLPSVFKYYQQIL